ncbi:helix-turn-helix domain-containing protein [Aureimonas glaciei]|uniref:AraC family transcriptional regulator n=1 Tax=Aureimonas glaciei TaxID=1776957 RepID=A0A917DE09_9HYPH|nr:helix-turn-helix domain-containing protein [Aureimonas glaciei]GGD29531.1 AraC family transcriptional regulator [Aureimonas glaciei]
MMRATFSTGSSPKGGSKAFWQEAVSQTYFPLDLRFQSVDEFDGTLDAWTLGSIAVSRNRCDGLLYRRHERHLLNEREESFLITVPEVAEIRFAQDGQEVLCRPGQFLIERSHLPYEFSHRERAALWVLKIPSDVLRARIARPERLATLQFDASRSVGALFVDMLRLTAPRLDEMEEAERAQMGRHLVDLLAMAIEADQRVLAGRSSSVRNAHLHRAEHFIGTRLHDPHLAPQTIADDCGISLRYLHQLFEAEGTTVSAHVRNRRLLMCDAALKDPHCRKAIAEIAYDWGFGDQAQFSRSYRARFGCTPSEVRAAARAASLART